MLLRCKARQQQQHQLQLATCNSGSSTHWRKAVRHSLGLIWWTVFMQIRRVGGKHFLLADTDCPFAFETVTVAGPIDSWL